VVAGVKGPVGMTEVTVLVKAVPPTVNVVDVDNVGVGEKACTNVVLAEITVIVVATEPDVIVTVLYTVGTPIIT
jgi:hypothetical protein